ncbi:MAG: hypothetical protein HY674_06980 [Chloroflexi bacterium]|nr:hypothetical protein [Chloroflexota bacterium]
MGILLVFHVVFVFEVLEGDENKDEQTIQADEDEHGSRSHAGSNPIWVKRKR